MGILPAFYGRNGGSIVTHIEFQEFCIHTAFTHKGGSLLGLSIIRNIVYDDIVSHFCKAHTDFPADSPASAGHQSVFSHNKYIPLFNIS